MSEVIYDDDAPKGDDAAAAANALTLFERELAGFENRLSTIFKLRRLGARGEVTEDGRQVVYDDLLSHLQFCVTGIRQPIQLPRTPIHLDAVLGGQECTGSTRELGAITRKSSRSKDFLPTPMPEF